MHKALSVAALVASSLAAAGVVRGQQLMCGLTIRAHVPADWDSTPLDRQLHLANGLFSSSGIRFASSIERTQTSATWRDVDDMERSLRALDREVIDVFVLSELRICGPESPPPELTTTGACDGFAVSPRGTTRHGADEFVAIRTSAVESTLAHELGHYFGLLHREVPLPGNIMNAVMDAGPWSFDSMQRDRLALMLRHFARRGHPLVECESP